MTKTMAEVLAEHDDDHVDSGYWYCQCGYEYGVLGGFGEARANHLEAALTAAGYGLVADAKREAWDEALGQALDAGHLLNWQEDQIRDMNPYRKASNDD